MCRDIKFVATSFSYVFASENCRDINFLFVTNIFTFQFLYFVTIEFSMLRHSFCGYSTTLLQQSFLLLRQDFFSGPYRWLNYFLQHRNLCCDKLVLAYLSSLHFLSRHNFPLLQHNSITLKLLLSQHKTFLSQQRFRLQFFIMSQHTTLLLQYSSCTAFQLLVAIENFFVAIEFTSTSCFVCHDRKLLCCDKVLLSFIMNSEFYVTTEFSFFATRILP